jgi:hypothetical protein
VIVVGLEEAMTMPKRGRRTSQQARRGPKTEYKWRRFERLVAALHASTVKGATVKWNEKIGRRQFDVTVRFNDGLYDHLTLIECKDHAKRVEVDDVDAFATKSRDAHATKAIIVSASGFQGGCTEVAKRHGIGLFALAEMDSVPAEMLGAAFTPTLVRNIYDVTLVLADEQRTSVVLPQDRNRLPYLLRNSVLESAGSKGSLERMVMGAFDSGRVTSDREERQVEIPCAHGTVVTRPDVAIAVRVAAIRAKHCMRLAYAVNDGLDSYVLSNLNATFEYKDISTDTPEKVVGPQLKIGFDTVMTPGKFYENRMGFFYYCNRIENGLMWLDLVESYQHGELLQATGGAMKIEDAQYYVEVTDQAEIERLTRMLQGLQRPRYRD